MNLVGSRPLSVITLNLLVPVWQRIGKREWLPSFYINLSVEEDLL